MKVHKRILTGYRTDGTERAIVLCGKFDPARYSWEDRDVTCMHCKARLERERKGKRRSFPGCRLSKEERALLEAIDVGADAQSRRVFEAAVRKGWSAFLAELPPLSEAQRTLAFAAFLRGLEQGFESATALMPRPQSVQPASIGDYLRPLRHKKKP